jgi:hypothetical protein
MKLRAGFVLGIALLWSVLGATAAWSQTTSTGGTLNVSVADQSGAAVPNANLELRDPATNDIRRGATQANGAYTFLNVPGGTYSLTIAAPGFANQVFESVQVKTSLETDLKATLKVGTTAESVTVTASETPLVQTEASTIANNIDTKQVFNLPVLGRNAFSLIYTTPGWASGTNGSSSGTFDNLPGAAIVSAEFDGTQSMSNRFRSSGYGYGSSVIDPRLENIAEFTVSTSQLDLSGNGTSAMRISIVTRRGSNQFHGRLYEDFRNTVLNANSWSNNANVNAQGVGTPRSITKFNDFGGSVGGPIIKNKLFFFGTWSERKNPATSVATINNAPPSILNPLAQQGIFQYRDNAGNLQQVNLFQIAAQNGLPATLNPVIKGELSAINGILDKGNVTPNASDPNVSSFTFLNPSNTTIYYPTVRIDYNKTEKLRFNVSYTQQKTSSPLTYAPIFPVIDTTDRTSYRANNKIIGFGADYMISPAMLNSFHAGYLYQFSIYDPENLGLPIQDIHSESWGYGQSPVGSNVYPRTAISSLYSMYNLSDSLTWQRGKHSLVFGGSAFREWDRYWNGPGGWPIDTLGLASTDPAYTAMNNGMSGINTTLQGNARALYATLVGRISAVNIAVGRPLDPSTHQYKPFGQYNLNEVQQSGGFWAQDRWRFRPDLTINFGLRWDIVGDDHDKDGAYTSAKSLADLYGPTSLGAMFQPGALNGIADPSFVARQHVYNTMWKNPQPAVAIAWNPTADSGFLGKLLGGNKTVIRTGYSLRNYQDGAQNFWAFASGGLFFYQQGTANPDPTATGPGYFKPGSLSLGDPTPAYLLSPGTWSPTIPGDQMFGQSFNTINPNIRLPYVESWNLGIQRELPGGNALEINYVGNLTLHSWLALNLNEVNIFENGFLTEFKNAQNNLTINQANGKGATPFNFGLAGQVPLPIFTAAFGNTNNSNWTGIVTNLQNGAAGTQARSMVSNTGFLCNVIGGKNFSPCAGYAGAGYPLNFWNINPYAKTSSLNYLDAAGMSDYESLQIQLRQRLTHGAQFTFNYTLAHSLTNGAVNNLQSQGYSPYTLRNLGLNYLDSPFDIRHVFRAIGTYDLPFGKNKKFLNRGGVVDAVFGNWTLGTVTAIQSGTPTTISGGYSTVTNAGSGVNFLGINAQQFQDGIHFQHMSACTPTGCTGWVQTFAPQYVAANGMANPQYLTPATTPGVFGAWPIFRAPFWWSSDMSATKSVPIHERWRFTLQASAVNVFNHPTIGIGSLNVTSTSFGRATPGGNRQLELRANLEF